MGKRLDKKIDILIRYRKSIYFDYFLLFIAEVITLFSGALFTIYFGNFGKIFLVFFDVCANSGILNTRFF
jgi:hypothetical protein